MRYRVEDLEYGDAASRLAILREMYEADVSQIRTITRSDSVAGFVPTRYSTGVHTPSAAVFRVLSEGVSAAAIVDEISTAGFSEARSAAGVVGLPIVTGVRVPLMLPGVSPVDLILYGVHERAERSLEELLEPMRTEALRRIERQTAAVNDALERSGVGRIAFDQDVGSYSLYAEGGALLSDHLYMAVAEQLLQTFGRGEALVDVLRSGFALNIGATTAAMLGDPVNPYVRFDILSLLHSGRAVPPEDPPAQETGSLDRILSAAERAGLVVLVLIDGRLSAGDAEALLDRGVHGFAYDLAAVDGATLAPFRRYASQRSVIELPASVSRSPRRLYAEASVSDPARAELALGLWALVAHSVLVERDVRYGLFHPDGPLAPRPLDERIEIYAGIARRSDARNPNEILDQVPPL